MSRRSDQAGPGGDDLHRFSEEEVREILRRAVAAMPRGDSSLPARTRGTTLAELKAIGTDVGIDPRGLEAAAREVLLGGVGVEGGRSGLLGGPVDLALDRRVAGSFAAVDAPDALALIRRVMGEPGEVDSIGDALEWTAEAGGRKRLVAIAERDGTTTVRVFTGQSELASAIYAPAAMAWGLAAILSTAGLLEGGGPVALILTLLALPLVYGVARTLFARASRAEEARLQGLADGLERLIAGDPPSEGPR